MADHTGIEWTDATWQVTHGCTLVSPGCTNCYAMRMAARLERMGVAAYAGLTQPSKAGPVWTGQVREADLGDVPQPLRWKKPRRIFVNSMSDLFHPDVSSDHIAHVFGIMACAQQHTFQVLTKRPERMAALLGSDEFWEMTNSFCTDYAMSLADPLARRTDDYRAIAQDGVPDDPPPNVWLGTSVEDQARADERIPHLLATPAALRFLSCEPLLGPIDFGTKQFAIYDRLSRGIRWVIAGGESGPGARPMHVDWVRRLRDESLAIGATFFFKQWGEWLPGVQFSAELSAYDSDDVFSRFDCLDWDGDATVHADEIGGMSGAEVYRVGKRRAGAMLDGCEWRDFPA